MKVQKQAFEIQEQLLSDEGFTLMLLNDNVNTFDFVIDLKNLQDARCKTL